MRCSLVMLSVVSAFTVFGGAAAADDNVAPGTVIHSDDPPASPANAGPEAGPLGNVLGPLQ